MIDELNKHLQPITIELIRNVMPEIIAKEICDTTPCDPNIMADLFAMAKSEENLIAEGYRPVCPHSPLPLLWIKDEPKNE